jgi:hypothetical protein
MASIVDAALPYILVHRSARAGDRSHAPLMLGVFRSTEPFIKRPGGGERRSTIECRVRHPVRCEVIVRLSRYAFRLIANRLPG